MQGRSRLEQALRQRGTGEAPATNLAARASPARSHRSTLREDPRLFSSSPPALAVAVPAPPLETSPRSSAARISVRQPRWRALAWCALGFASGIVFWHFVGFWSFVSEVVFKADPATSIAARVRDSAPSNDRRKLQTTVYGGIPATGSSNVSACTLLRLDRSTSRTTALSCDESPLPVAGTPPPRRWSQAPAAAPAAPAPVAAAPPLAARRGPALTGWSTSVRQVSDADPDSGVVETGSVREMVR